MDDHIDLGIEGHVVRIAAADGRERWRTKLRGRTLTTVIAGKEALYAFAHGHLHALDCGHEQDSVDQQAAGAR